jgi:hypothetical protein
MSLAYDATWTEEFRDAANFDVVCSTARIRVHREIMMHRCHAAIPFLNESLVLLNEFGPEAAYVVLSMIYNYGISHMDVDLWSWDVIRLLDFLGADELIRLQDAKTAASLMHSHAYSPSIDTFLIGIPEFPMMTKSWEEIVATCKTWMRSGHSQYLVVHVFPKLAPSLLTAIIGTLARPALFHRSLVPASDYVYTDSYTLPLENGSWTVDVFDTMLTVTLALRTVFDRPDSVCVKVSGPRNNEEFGSMEEAYDCVRQENIRVIAIKADVMCTAFKDALTFEVYDATVLHMATMTVPLCDNLAYFPADITLSFAKLTT